MFVTSSHAAIILYNSLISKWVYDDLIECEGQDEWPFNVSQICSLIYDYETYVPKSVV